jgi:hypothetical protein
LEKVSVQYLPEIENFINDFSDLLFEKEYFSFYEYASNYVDNLTFFIEKELHSFPQKTTPNKLKRFGSYYAFYRPNNRTTWYIFFEKSGNRLLITYLTNNHVKELNDL